MRQNKTIVRRTIDALHARKTARTLSRLASPMVKYRRWDGEEEIGRVLMQASGTGNYRIIPLSGGCAEVIHHGDIIASV